MAVEGFQKQVKASPQILVLFRCLLCVAHDAISLAKTGRKEFQMLVVTKLVLSLNERNSKATAQKGIYLGWEESALFSLPQLQMS